MIRKLLQWLDDWQIAGKPALNYLQIVLGASALGLMVWFGGYRGEETLVYLKDKIIPWLQSCSFCRWVLSIVIPIIGSWLIERLLHLALFPSSVEEWISSLRRRRYRGLRDFFREELAYMLATHRDEMEGVPIGRMEIARYQRLILSCLNSARRHFGAICIPSPEDIYRDPAARTYMEEVTRAAKKFSHRPKFLGFELPIRKGHAVRIAVTSDSSVTSKEAQEWFKKIHTENQVELRFIPFELFEALARNHQVDFNKADFAIFDDSAVVAIEVERQSGEVERQSGSLRVVLVDGKINVYAYDAKETVKTYKAFIDALESIRADPEGSDKT